MAETRENLLAPESVTTLPEDPAYRELLECGPEGFLDVVKGHPDSLLCWALLAEGSLNANTLASDVAAYAYARTGYHRGLDALRRNGWRGSGAVPWEHESNRGFLRALWALSRAAERLGEMEEAQRCAQFLRDSSQAGYQALTNPPPKTTATKPATPKTPTTTTAKSSNGRTNGGTRSRRTRRPQTKVANQEPKRSTTSG